MPELPEVENIAITLRDLIQDKTLTKVTCLRPSIIRGPADKDLPVFLEKLKNKRITTITRRAKRLIISLQNSQAMVFQLGMTGKLLVHDFKKEIPKHTHIILHLKNNCQINFADTRRFGKVWLFDKLDPNNPDPAMLNLGMGKLGPDATDISEKAFNSILNSTRMIKTLLLDQTRIAGLGNIYVDESLFAAGIHPEKPSINITPKQSKKLLKCIKSILKCAIRAGGTTIIDFKNPYGDMGLFHKRLQVYARSGQPCNICKTVIEKMVISGRSTHICPTCQE